MLAMAIPDLDGFISLIGAVASSALALIFPPLIEMLVFWRGRGTVTRFLCCEHLWPLWVIKNVAIVLLGILGMLFGTGTSVYAIYQFFKDHPPEQSCDKFFPH